MNLHRSILVLLILVLPAQAARFSPPMENFEAQNQLRPLEQEISQDNPPEIAGRMEALLIDHGDEMMKEDGGLVSVAAWTERVIPTDKPALIAEYRKQFDAEALKMLDSIREIPSHRAEDLYAVFRRYPLSTAAMNALALAGERSAELGDFTASNTYFSLAQSKGWKPATTENSTPSARPAVARFPAGLVPCDVNWYMISDGYLLPKYFPVASDGLFFLTTPREVVALKENGISAWRWTPTVTPGDIPAANRPADSGRGQLFAPAVLCDAGGSARIIVIRQPRGTGEFCFRAFRANDGKLLWTTETDETPQGLSFIGEPAIVGRFVYAVALQSTADGGMLEMIALDVTTGRMIWQTSFGVVKDFQNLIALAAADADSHVSDDVMNQSPPTAVGSRLFVAPNVGWLVCFDRFDGKLRMMRSYPTPAGNVEQGRKFRLMRVQGRKADPNTLPPMAVRWNNRTCVVKDVVIAAPQDAPGIFGFDSATGKLLWQTDAPQSSLIGATGAGAVVAGRSMSMLETKTGEARWTFQPTNANITGPPTLAENYIHVPTTTAVVSVSIMDGSVRASPYAIPNFRNTVSSVPGKAILDDAGALRFFGLPIKE